MKSLKKYLVGMVALLVMGLVFVAAPKPAAAANPAQYNDMVKCLNSFQWKDYAHITCQLGSNQIVFADSDPTNQDYQHFYKFTPPPGTFCGADPSLYSDWGNNEPEGLIVDAVTDQFGNLGNHGTWSVVAFNEGYADPPVPNQPAPACQSFERKFNGEHGQSYGSTPALISGGHERSHIILQGTIDGAQSFPDVTNGPFANHSFGRWKSQYDTQFNGKNVYLFGENLVFNVSGQQCSGNILAVEADSNGDSVDAYEYTLGSGGDPLTKYPPLKKVAAASAGGCNVSNTNFGSGDLTNPTIPIYISPAIKNMSAIAEGNGSSNGNSNNGSGGGSTSECAFNDTAMEWIVCPIITAVSKSADQINNFVESQLNFSVHENLTNDVQRAWTVFKDLVSAILVIFMLIMVIAQAIGGGSFLEAYTIKKLLPRLVAAIILMQVSWAVCTYAIQLANDAGNGIAQLMQAPFGGGGRLDLPSLLNHLNALVGLGVGTVTTTGAIFAIFFAPAVISWGWPVLLLGVILVLISLIVALATLLVRNALIIILVMLSPLAFLAWVLPGTQEYWKKWKSNFIKLLMFFPLVMTMIWGGRIFAWVVGGLGRSGPLDLIMVLVGFFLPYFFLPKSFKWGGDLLSSASKMINDNALTKAGRSTANKYLGFKDENGAGYRKQQALIDKYYSHLTPADRENMNDQLKSMNWRQRLAWRAGKDSSGQGRWRHYAKNAAVRTLGGSPIPTMRATAVMDKRVGEWKKNEIDLMANKMNNDYKEFQKNGLSVQEAKERVRDKYWSYDPNKSGSLSNRSFLSWGRATKSYMEMGQAEWRMGGHKIDGVWVPPSIRNWNPATKTGIDQNGNTVTEAGLASHWNRDSDMAKSQGWIDWLHGDPEAYSDISQRLPAFVPYRLARGGGPDPTEYLPGGRSFAKNTARTPQLQQQAAPLLADSARFAKAIDQAEDPAAVASWRPEHYEELANISAVLTSNGMAADGAARLKQYIEEQSQTLAGRNILQRLSGYAENHIDAMFGQGYLQSKLEDPRAQRAAAAAAGGGPGGGGPGGGGPGGGGPGGGGPGGGGPGGGGPGGQQAPGFNPAAGQLNLQPGATIQPGQPTELRIDHDALADTIKTATKQGIRAGLREAGIHRPSGTLPGETEGERDIFPGEKG